MKAFRLAVEKGYGIELDVQLSADGVPVVFHDNTLARMCGVNRRVRELTLAELKALSLGGTEERIPTFQEFLEMVDGRVPLIVEIKMEKWDARIPAAANELLKEYKGPYCIESFHPGALVWYRKHRPDVFRGQLCTNFNKEHMNHSLPYFLLGKMLTNIAARPDFIAYNWKYRNDLSRRICCDLYHDVYLFPWPGPYAPGRSWMNAGRIFSCSFLRALSRMPESKKMIRFARPPSGFIAQKARRPLRPAGGNLLRRYFPAFFFIIYEIKSLMDMNQPSIGIMVLPSSIFFAEACR